MRALFTCQPELGHFLPLTPVARALVDAGHDVVFGTPDFLRPTVETAGFRWVRAGVENDDPEMAAVRPRLLELRGFDQSRFVAEHIFGGIRPRRMVPDLLALATSWRPDLFVRDSCEHGALITAELLKVPHAKVEIFASGTRPRFTTMTYEPLQQLRMSLGLPVRSMQDLIDQYVGLAAFPATLNTVGDPIPPTVHHLRVLPADGASDGLPAWIDTIGSRPLVYVSLGTVFSGRRGPEIFSKLLTGLRDVDAEIVLTVGNDLDPASFGPQPEHIHLERYLPLQALLPHCSLVIFHGGSGTLAHVVANGLPMVILPLGADQFDNAARCAELGASRTLDPDQLTPEHIREVVLDVLHTPTYRQNAERLRDEFDALPGVDYAVALLERLAREKTPIMASH